MEFTYFNIFIFHQDVYHDEFFESKRDNAVYDKTVGCLTTIMFITIKNRSVRPLLIYTLLKQNKNPISLIPDIWNSFLFSWKRSLRIAKTCRTTRVTLFHRVFRQRLTRIELNQAKFSSYPRAGNSNENIMSSCAITHNSDTTRFKLNRRVVRQRITRDGFSRFIASSYAQRITRTQSA